jgi:MoxR-like ATPase
LRATQPPIVILTSNRTRDLHDALKRRCLYHWIDYPDLEHATRIVHMRLPGANETLVAQIAGAVQRLRSLDLQKPPGIAEAIDWAHAAQLLGIQNLNGDDVMRTLGSVLKYREDQDAAIDQGVGWVAGV